MPPLFRKKLTTEVGTNKVKKPRVPFKTPLLSKFRLANFLKVNSEAEATNESISVDTVSDCHHASDNTEDLINLERRDTYIQADSLFSETQNTQASSEATAISSGNTGSKLPSENDASGNQIVPTVTAISNTDQIINSPEMFETSGSTGQVTMNDPAVKEAYLDFLEQKNTPHSQISSQSSNYSINDPEIKKMYLDFMRSKTDAETINKPDKSKQSKKIKEHAQKKTNKNSTKNIRHLHRGETKQSNKSNKKVNHTDHPPVDEHDQKKPKTEAKIRKSNKSEVNSLSHIDIKFSKTTSSTINSKSTKLVNQKSHKKKHVQDKHSKKIVLSKDSTKVEAQKETSKFIRSTQKFQSQKEKLEWVLEVSNTGTYVICDRCEKTRYLADVLDPLELPEKWYCENNPDTSENACIIPQRKIPDEVEAKLIENLYNAGSIVWARLQGYPWWPAMVDVCPDVEDFFWLDNLDDQIPTWYNVTYFDTSSVTRSWLKPINIIPFQKYSNPNKHYNIKVPREMSYRLEKSIKMAQEAVNLPLTERLRQYSFVYRYNKPINKPRSQKKDEKKAHKKNINKIPSNGCNKKRVNQMRRIESYDSEASTLSNLFEFDIEPDIAVQELF